MASSHHLSLKGSRKMWPRGQEDSSRNSNNQAVLAVVTDGLIQKGNVGWIFEGSMKTLNYGFRN